MRAPFEVDQRPIESPWLQTGNAGILPALLTFFVRQERAKQSDAKFCCGKKGVQWKQN
jgi:hypothetical protein